MLRLESVCIKVAKVKSVLAGPSGGGKTYASFFNLN